MTDSLNKRRAECLEFRSQLEDVAGAAPSAKEVSELLAATPVELRAHVAGCANCRAAAENILETRALLAELPSNAGVAGPWFAPRVMAAIAARKAELGRAADTWTFLPKLAARLTWASAVALLLASGWLYQKPVSTSTKPAVLTDITGEPFVDTAAPPANDDEVLLSLAEKPR
jgi:anti-sigma factor RsiW